jgi:hypothetical protein
MCSKCELCNICKEKKKNFMKWTLKLTLY